jgi:hypothetical protein
MNFTGSTQNALLFPPSRQFVKEKKGLLFGLFGSHAVVLVNVPRGGKLH